MFFCFAFKNTGICSVSCISGWKRIGIYSIFCVFAWLPQKTAKRKNAVIYSILWISKSEKSSEKCGKTALFSDFRTSKTHLQISPSFCLPQTPKNVKVPTSLFEIAELVNLMTDKASRAEAMQHNTMASSNQCPPAVLLVPPSGYRCFRRRPGCLASVRGVLWRIVSPPHCVSWQQRPLALCGDPFPLHHGCWLSPRDRPLETCEPQQHHGFTVLLFLFPFPISNLAGPWFHPKLLQLGCKAGFLLQPGGAGGSARAARSTVVVCFFCLCLKMASKSLLVLCGHLSWILGLLEVSIARLPQAS